MMEMEFTGEFTGTSTDQSQIIRGKRTKRQRPSSPFAVAAATSSSSSGGGGGVYFSIQSSPTTSSDISTTKEEEEDMANCLIMLAQSVSPIKSDQEEKIITHNHHHQKMEKLSSRKFTEMTTTTGKAGFYVYECKTCNRAFPSFQALGGHRASHKKLKTMVEAPLMEYCVEAEEQKVVKEIKDKSINYSSPSHPSSPPPGFANTYNKGKVHECSICGLEFLSGQALGGHMRRHRTTSVSLTSNSTARIGITVNIDDSSVMIKKPRNGMLSLDLNLPAPPEEDHHHRDSKFQFTTNPQHRVFSATPSLVDCHY